MIWNSNATLIKAQFPIATTGNRTEWRAHVAYNTTAAAYFVTYTMGRRVFPQAEITKEILRRSTYMDRYSKTLKEILEYDSLRTAILNPVEPPPPEIDEEDTSASEADSLAAQPQGPVLSLDSIKTLLAGSRSEMGGLFFNTINVPDSARYWYTLVVEEHPESRYGSLALFAIAQLQSLESPYITFYQSQLAVPASIALRIEQR